MDYLADLGVGSVWLSPVYKSPMKDNGYDVEDYLSIDPVFGTLEDFKVRETNFCLRLSVLSFCLVCVCLRIF
jgi:maltooligosyltrehalose synthase